MSVLGSIFNRNTLGAGFVALTSVFVASTDAEAGERNGGGIKFGDIAKGFIAGAAQEALRQQGIGGGYYGGGRGRDCDNVPRYRTKYVNGVPKRAFSHTETVCHGRGDGGNFGGRYNGRRSDPSAPSRGETCFETRGSRTITFPCYNR